MGSEGSVRWGGAASNRAERRGEAACGESTYLADEDLRMMSERRLELAIQICIDIGAHLVSELSARAPGDYAGIFTSLADANLRNATMRNAVVRSVSWSQSHSITVNVGALGQRA
jgi:uncharacterized protein YutE (UPF0331/DUF86 family)